MQPALEDTDYDPGFDREVPFRESSTLDGDADESAILEKYGPQVGQEVITMLRRARNNAEAHIEPAWRIPSNIIPPRLSSSSQERSRPTEPLSPPPIPTTEVPFEPPSPLNGISVWKPSKVSVSKKQGSTSNRRRERIMKRIRAESEDPLQDGFVSDRGVDIRNSEPSGSEYEEDVSQNAKRSVSKIHVKGKDDEDEQIKALRESTCIYCGRKWKTRAGVICHWTRLVATFPKSDEEQDDGIHDIEYIRVYRDVTKVRTPRAPRLVVCDFRTMIELHEGAGLSFAEIADCGALRTRKTGLGLVQVYDRYRIAPENEAAPKAWTAQELGTLNKLCENPNRDLSTFSKKLSRTDADIAGKLAEIWLQEMRVAGRPPQNAPVSAAQPSPRAEQGHRRTNPQDRRASTEDPLFIKEESEDELFGVQRR